MKALKSMIALSLLGLASLAQAEEDFSYSDYARVTRVTPQYERVNTPRRECKTEIISSYERQPDARSNDRSVGGAIIGGVAGGVVGNRFGKGNGRTAATAVGAVIGAIVGDRIDNGDRGVDRRAEYEPQEREIKRCRVLDNWENRIVGYQVDFDYNGHAYSRFMTEEPERKFRVRVSVEPE